MGGRPRGPSGARRDVRLDEVLAARGGGNPRPAARRGRSGEEEPWHPRRNPRDRGRDRSGAQRLRGVLPQGAEAGGGSPPSSDGPAAERPEMDPVFGGGTGDGHALGGPGRENGLLPEPEPVPPERAFRQGPRNALRSGRARGGAAARRVLARRSLRMVGVGDGGSAGIPVRPREARRAVPSFADRGGRARAATDPSAGVPLRTAEARRRLVPLPYPGLDLPYVRSGQVQVLDRRKRPRQAL